MNKSKATAFVVEDSASSGALYCKFLEMAGYETRWFTEGKSALIALNDEQPDVLIQDVCLPDISGIDVLQYVQRKGLNVPVIVITANSSIEVAVDAMRHGGFDFLEKPFSKDQLIASVETALRETQSTPKVTSADQSLPKDVSSFFVGQSSSMKTVFRILNSAARTKATVFITGESGTGKEVCAQALHSSGGRAEQPFVALNCASIPAELFESEIFGHVKGAFTGALQNREGAASRASGGTLFLDELCEMDLSLQAKLLRFIQTGKYTPVGSTEEKSADIRFICATNRNPAKEISAGRFREDLFYRLNVVPVHLPPLRERGNDVIEIADQFLHKKAAEHDRKFTGFDSSAKAKILSYDWPGNIRELQNIIENLVVTSEEGTIAGHQIQINLSESTPQLNPAPQSLSKPEPTHAPATKMGDIQPLWMIEKNAIESAIAICDGNIPLAAACLGVSASTIYRKIKTWDVEQRHSGELS